MITKFSKDFDKQFAKLPHKRQDKVMRTINSFLDQPTHTTLRNHPLSAGGDLRLHFKLLENGVVYFVAVGTHSQLYK